MTWLTVLSASPRVQLINVYAMLHQLAEGNQLWPRLRIHPTG